MATVTGTITVTTTSTQQATGLPGSVTQLTVTQNLNTNFQTSGTVADEVDLNYVDTITLAAAVTTLDLTALTDRYGNAVNFARVRSIMVKNKSTTNGENVTIKPGTSNGWTGLLGTGSTLILGPSTSANTGMILVTNPSTTGWATSGTSKALALDPGANTIDVDIEINGASA